MHDGRGWTDSQIEVMIGRLLQMGVTLAALVVAIGGTLYLAHHGSEAPEYAVFRGEPAYLRDVRLIVEEAFTFRGRPLIQLGLLLLVATPVARVLLSVLAFARQRDFVYVAITLFVAAVLLFSIVGTGR